MAETWANFGDLHLELPATGGRRQALEQELRSAIRSGRLPGGTRLPASRTLARDLGLARGTVVDAYAQLVVEGYLRTRAGAGTIVAPGVEPLPSPETIRPAADGPSVVDLRPGTPDLGSFPRQRWVRATRSALATAPDQSLGYGEAQGDHGLRVEVAAYLGRTRGVATTPERLVVTAGFAHALTLLLQVLRDAGASRIAMEDPCLVLHRRIVRREGMGVVPIPVDGDGARPELSGDGDEEVGAAVITPAHHFPLGITLAPERRADWLAWARRHDRVVIEDDYDGEFRYDRQAIGALQGLDPDHVVYGGTTSKSLAPGVRLGWLALPERLVDPVRRASELADQRTASLSQLALAELLRDGSFDRHVRGRRTAYRARRDHLVQALAAGAPWVEPTGVAAGLHLLVRLPGATEGEVVEHLRSHDVLVGSLAPHRHRPGGEAALVVGYTRPADHEYRAAVDRLVTALSGWRGRRGCARPPR
jgi:GntR family transcriptional regulator / MocR family aminotransferase